ncbi:MAG: hypothetical protein C4288_19625 [Leptolyngbya sp. ERB_1_1]
MQKSWIVGSLVGVGMILSTASVSVAQMQPEQMQPTQISTTFRRIDQPLWLKGAVTAGGIGLIGGELWWLLFSRFKSRRSDRL